MQFTDTEFRRLLFVLAAVAKADVLTEAGCDDEDTVADGTFAEHALAELLDCYAVPATMVDQFWCHMREAAAGFLGVSVTEVLHAE